MDMTVEMQSSGHDLDVPVADESLIEDWLGLAGYLAEAVAAADVDVAKPSGPETHAAHAIKTPIRTTRCPSMNLSPAKAPGGGCNYCGVH
jgi:hypothetical protein